MTCSKPSKVKRAKLSDLDAGEVFDGKRKHGRCVDIATLAIRRVDAPVAVRATIRDIEITGERHHERWEIVVGRKDGEKNDVCQVGSHVTADEEQRSIRTLNRWCGNDNILDGLHIRVVICDNIGHRRK